MRVKYTILQGNQVLATGSGIENPPIFQMETARAYTLLTEAEQAFEQVTGLRLHLDREEDAGEPTATGDHDAEPAGTTQ